MTKHDCGHDHSVHETLDPFGLFDEWLGEAEASEPNDGNAMALATADETGRPSVRMVLLKGHGPDGFVFYTNLQGRKAGELAANPHAALLFHWKSLRRQIRVEGVVAPVTEAEADAYFATRGRESQVGAWASDQSRPLSDRSVLVDRFEAVRDRFEGGPVIRPPYWSGFRLVPDAIEFWRDGAHRLHERMLFLRAPGGDWRSGLLYP